MSKEEDFLYDERIVEMHIKDGTLSKKDYEKHLKSLPDVEEKGEVLIIEEDEDEVVVEVELEQVEEDETE
ncbi:MAG: hypothetical protein E4H21_00565 [Thermodesulfobacteriales bacterium]|jgi:hypothetical protein|nr:MAG: hypothetical protein E4H21_00565 [Thermodesulfobacteriales bacterium]